ATCCRTIGEDRDVGRRWNRGPELGQQRFHAVGRLNDVRARLPLDVEDYGGFAADPAGEPHVLDVVDYFADVAQPHRPAILVGDDHRTIIRGGKNLIVGADGVRLTLAVEAAFRRIDVVQH